MEPRELEIIKRMCGVGGKPPKKHNANMHGEIKPRIKCDLEINLKNIYMI
jgi:hypothetical protein